MKILLVEDTASDAELLSIALKKAPSQKFTITRARAWSEAVEHLGKDKFDVMLLDLSLPDSNGAETFRRARSQAPQLPIIVLTGNEDEAIALEAARHGIEDFLVKGPKMGTQVARTVRYALERARTRATLDDYRELIRVVMESSTDAVFAKDLSGRYILMNNAAARVAGLTAEEAVGKDDAALFKPEDAKALTEADRSVLTAGKPIAFEETIHLPGNGRRIYLSTKGPLRRGTGEVTGVFGISHDVTEMKQAEKRLQGVAALLNLFSMGSSRREYLTNVIRLLKDWCGCRCVGVRLLNKDGRLPFAAQAGFTPRFLRYENQLSLVTDDCACVRVLSGRPRAEDLSCTSPGGSLSCRHTTACAEHLRAPDETGPVRCAEAGYESLVHTPLRYRNRLLGSLHFADSQMDKFSPQAVEFIEASALLISEAIHRLDVEASLVESEARFRSVFERNASVMLLIEPRTGAIVDANPAGVAFYGYSLEQLRKMKLSDLHQLPAQDSGAARLGKATEGPRSFWMIPHRLANGETRMVEAHSSPLQLQGRRLLVFIIHDITERALLQKQVLEIGERERQRVGRDLHDSLGGKLTGAALMGKALAQKLASLNLPEADLAEEVVECINESIRQTRSIARGLYPLDLSGAGLAGALAELAAETERRSGIRCQFHGDKGFQLTQPLVALHLFRLATEAITNAVKHGKPRHINISLLAASSHFELQVRDDGKGIPADLPSTVGMGLRTMRYRAESIGARLDIGPAQPRGTIVSCVLSSGRVGEAFHWEL